MSDEIHYPYLLEANSQKKKKNTKYMACMTPLKLFYENNQIMLVGFVNFDIATILILA